MQFLPPALAPFGAHRQFITYIVVPSATRPGKTDKFPTDYRTGKVCSAHDPSNWGAFGDVDESNYAHGPDQGIGFVITKNAGFWFLDVDNCITPEGAWSPIALQMFAAFPNVAIELSQSGKGLHFFGHGPAPEHRKRNKEWNIEFYTEQRFAALTGNMLTEGVASAQAVAGSLDWLVTSYFPPIASNDDDRDEWPETPRADWRGSTTDEDLIRRAVMSKSAASAFGDKASFADLWTANEDVLARAYPSGTGDAYDRSMADAGLAAHLAFWTGCEAPRIERLMRASALVREKWDRHQTYMRITITNACARQVEVLHDKPIELPQGQTSTAVAQAIQNAPQPAIVEMAGAPYPYAPASPAAPPAAMADTSLLPTMRMGTGFVPIDDQGSWFAGCVYVMEKHAALIPGGQIIKPDAFKVMFGGASFVMDRSNERVSRDAWECFTQSQAIKFPKVTATCFRPELASFSVIHEEDRSMLNVYKPIDTYRCPGDPTPFLNLVAKILPVERDRRILLTYMAQMVRNPGRKFQWWPVLQGTVGNGKSVFIRVLSHCVGHRYTHLPNPEEMAKSGNKFNGWVENNLFIGIEEIYVADRRNFLEAFKATVTNDRIGIETKGVDQRTGDNRANGMMCTNHRDGVPTDVDQRRYSIFFTAQQNALDKIRDGMSGSYFPLFYQWLKGEGLFAEYGRNFGYGVVNDYLRTCEIDEEFDPAGMCQIAPKTSSSAQAVIESLGPVEQEIIEAVESGAAGFKGGWISSVMLDRLLATTRAKGLAHNKRKEMLRALGYVQHPALMDGRVANNIMPDGAKPRLYVRADRADLITLVTPTAVIAAYTDAQQ